MAGKRWKEEEIIEVLREAEKSKLSVSEVCRNHGIADVTFYKWRKRYGGVEKTEVRRMRELEKENEELKKALGEHVIMINAVKEQLKKKGLGLKEQRELVRIGTSHGLSERKACEVMGFNRSSVRYVSKGPCELTLQVEKKAIELSRDHQANGYKSITAMLQRLGYPTGKTRVFNIWQRNDLSLPVRRRRKRTRFPYVRPCKATKLNDVWCYDFLFVRTEHGETLKIFAVLDEYSRECLAIYVNRRINSEGVKQVLEKIVERRGTPKYVRSDNGPEFISKNLRKWLSKRRISPHYIDPGSPWQNGFIESFNGKFRAECLNREMLWSRGEAQTVCNWWRQVYNYFRPHSSLEGKTPKEFAVRATSATLQQPLGLDKMMAHLN